MRPYSRLAIAFAVASGVSAGGAACGAFSLNDVVPLRDAAAPDAADVIVVDGGDGGDGSGPCVPADPCTCLSKPAVVTAGAGGIDAMKLAGGYLYFLASPGGNPSLYRTPVDGDGGPPQPISPTSVSWSGNDNLAILDPFVYLVIGNVAPRILRFPEDGGAQQTLTGILPATMGTLAQLRAGSDALYWTNSSGEICTAALDGGLPAGDSGCGGAPLSPPLTDASVNTQMALTDSGLWLSASNGTLKLVPLMGGLGNVVAKGLPLLGHSPIVADDSNVFYFYEQTSSVDGGIVYHETIAGGDAAVVVVAASIEAITADDTSIYFVEGKDPLLTRHIYSVPRDGGAPHLLACDDQTPSVLAVDAQNLYWADTRDGQILRTPK
jgi:hypothetical protein